ncbi:phage holin family protein [Micromonospora sp. CPCC 206060]|uniref:phage holin family protein n=1 Tax=Micromonospora sp. CPCC 206060 TaxID=3122406 RepID=UPI002FEFD846
MADVASRGTSRPGGEASTAELVQRATEQVTRLIRDELALARAELTEKGRHAGKGVGLFGGGGALALYGLGVLIAAVVLLLASVMPAWVAALIVAVALFAVAGVLALAGKKQVSQAVPPMPKETVRSVRADVDTVTAAVRDRGRS